MSDQSTQQPPKKSAFLQGFVRFITGKKNDKHVGIERPQDLTPSVGESAPILSSQAVPSDPVASPPVEWADLGLSAEALKLIEGSGFKRPTPIQARAIPVALQGRDVIASAQTGTGKTASFVLPLVEKIAGRDGPYAIILAPTREIAQQIQGTVKLFAEPRGLKSVVLIGGIDMRYDTQALANYPNIIIATPGRLCDHIERGNVWLEFTEVLVLDEADRMLDMGFSDQLNKIVGETRDTRQTLLFSATFPPSVEKFAKKILNNPERIAMGKMAAAKTVTQRLLMVREEDKNRELRRILSEEKGSVIVFTRSKDGATRVFRSLHSSGFYDVTYLHSDRIQAHREQALAEFREGKYRILVATDVAGRGIHVDDVAHVVNYDLPLEAEDYIHRVGRTGRAEAEGKATSFATHRDRDLLRAIEKLLGKPIPRIGETAPAEPAAPLKNAEAPSTSTSRDPKASRPAAAGAAAPLAIPVPLATPIPRPAPRSEQPTLPPTATATGAPKSATPPAPVRAKPATETLRPSQRPGPIRAIDLLPPAEFYEGEAGLDWDAGDPESGDAKTRPSVRPPNPDPSKRRKRRRRRGGGSGGRPSGGTPNPS